MAEPTASPGGAHSRGAFALAAAALIAALLALDPAPRISYPVDAEATHALLGESLLRDGDALYRAEDLSRGYRSWAGGPRGLRLAPVDGGRELAFGVAPLYAVLTLPFRAVFGRSGPLVANGLALAAAGLLVRRRLAGRGRPAAAWWLGAAALSPLAVYAVLPQPQAVLTAATAAAAVLWLDHRDAPRRRRAPWTAIGLLLGGAAAIQPSLAAIAAAIAADLAVRRRARELGTALLAGALAWLGAMALWGALTGGGWGAGSVRVYAGDYPVADPAADAVATGAPPQPFPGGGRTAGSHPLTWRRLAVESWYWICGRSGGLAVLFPGALVALVAAAWRERGRPQLLLLAAALGIAAAAVWARAAAVPGEAGTLGARDFAAALPLLLLAAERLPPKPMLALAAAAGAVWTAPALVAVLATGAPADPSTGGPLAALRLLPAELTRLGDGDRFGWTILEAGGVDRDGALWAIPSGIVAAGGGRDRLWLRGDARSEIWVVAPQPLGEIALTARARSPGGFLELRSGGTRLRARFDTADKRAGTPLAVPAVPRVAGLGVFARREVFHRFTVATGPGLPGTGGRDGRPGHPHLDPHVDLPVLPVDPAVQLDLDPSYRVAPRAVHEARRDRR